MYPDEVGQKSEEGSDHSGDPLELINQTDFDKLQTESPEALFQSQMEQKTQSWLQRPAPLQVTDTKQNDVAYLEGNYEYNIWYDKYLTDMNKHQKAKRMPALHKCNPDT